MGNILIGRNRRIIKDAFGDLRRPTLFIKGGSLNAERIESAPTMVWWEQNWRKGGLQERRQELLREYNFYNQQYCGCEYSKRDRE